MSKKRIRKQKPGPKVDVLDSGDVSARREASYIVKRAQAGDQRVVTLGHSLLFFSTRQRDAWLIDFEDRTATCLCLRGERQPYGIREEDERFWIDWEVTYEINTGSFVIYDDTGQTMEFDDYPISEIKKAIGTALSMPLPQ